MANAPELIPSQKPPVEIGPGPHPEIRPFVIGGTVRVERPFLLAPMSGVTDSAFRRMCGQASTATVGLYVTEFISVEGLTRANMKSAARLAFDAAVERPLAVQIFGGESERMANAARIVADAGAQIVDINCGCPAPKVVKRGGGAELMRQCDALGRMVERVVAAVRVPVTVKIRSGWSADSVNAVEVAQRVEAAGAQMITVHGRTRLQLYTGFADWQVVEDVAANVRIPVVGSGDVTTAAEAIWRARTPGIAGVMIGRAAIMNPWIFGQIDDLVCGRPQRTVSGAERLRVLRAFADMAAERIPPHAIPGRLKQVLARMTKGMEFGAVLREKVMREPTTHGMLATIEEFFAAVDHGEVAAWAEVVRGGVPVLAADQLASAAAAAAQTPVPHSARPHPPSLTVGAAGGGLDLPA